MNPNKKTALILGSTGLVGRELVKALIELNAYDCIHLFVRSPIQIESSICQQHVVDFHHLEDYADWFKVHDVFCCLGTTIKKAKSKEAFRKVDYDYPVKAAELAVKAGAEKYLIVSSMGANPNSMFFYSQVKGEVEEILKGLGIPSLHIFRPSLLLGEREEFRFGEKLAEKANNIFQFLMVGPIRPYKGIEAKKVAKGMALTAQTNKKGIHIYSSIQIEEIGK